MIQTVIKRDGRVVGFNEEKIVTAIRKAMLHTDKGEDLQLIRQITDHISFKGSAQMTVEAIQDAVEMELMKSSRKDVAQKYIAYRNQRSIARKAKTRDMFLEIIEIKSNDVTRENANMNADTPAGMMMKFASETTKPFVDDYLLSDEVLEAVSGNYLHIHDKDYYPTKSLTCVQHPLDRILTCGFSAGHGESRPAKRIETASILGCISLETAQNEMHGGQAIPAFDFYLAPYVRRVPVRLISDLTEKNIERSTVGYIYEEVILKDLLEAARLMDPLPLMRKNFRINQPAIHILLSRVYLYMENYKECIAEVEKAEKQGIELLNMVNNLDVILTNSGYAPISYNNPEVEWFFGPSVVANHWEYQPGTAPAFRVLWDQVNDQRFLAYALKTASDDNSVYLKKPMSSSELGQSVRSAEAFLNRMEAYALSGEEGLALAELNAFRKTRVIGYTDVNLSGQALLDAIRLERRKELCFEGHRWFDLRRQGMPEIKHTYKAEKGGAVYEYVLQQGDPMYTIPFPNSVVLQNRALVQNPSREMGARQGEIQ